MEPITPNNNLTPNRTTSIDNSVMPVVRRSVSALSLERKKQTKFLNDLQDVLQEIFPDDDFSFFNNYRKQVNRNNDKDRFNSEKFINEFDNKLRQYFVAHGLYNLCHNAKQSNTLLGSQQEFIKEIISTTITTRNLIYDAILSPILHKTNNNIQNSFLKSGIMYDFCSETVDKFQKIAEKILNEDHDRIVKSIDVRIQNLEKSGLYKKPTLNSQTYIHGNDFFNYCIPFDTLFKKCFEAIQAQYNVSNNTDKDTAKIASLKQKEASALYHRFVDLAKKRANSIFVYTSDVRMKDIPETKRQDYIFSTGEYAPTEHYGATGLLEVIQDFEASTSYVKDALEIRKHIEDTHKQAKLVEEEQKARKAEQELLEELDKDDLATQFKNLKTTNKSTKKNKNKNKKNNTKKTKNLSETQAISEDKTHFKPAPTANIIASDNILEAQTLEEFIEVEAKKIRPHLHEYQIPQLNTFLENDEYISYINPDKSHNNMIAIKLNQGDDSFKEVKIYLSKYCDSGNAFMNHIQKKRPEFHNWVYETFHHQNDNNPAKGLLETALRVLNEGNGATSITKSYTDDFGIVHDNIKAFQIKIPLTDTTDNTEKQVCLRLHKDRYSRLVLVTAFATNR